MCQIIIITIIISTVLLLSAFISNRNTKTGVEVDRLTEQYESNVRAIDEISDYNRILSLYKNDEDMKRIYHDMSYHMHSYTGNTILDCALSYKKKQAEASGIKVKIVSSGEVSWNISDADTVSVIFNIIDNAIEGAANIEDAFIHIDIFGGDISKLIVANSKNPLKEKDTYLNTTKNDKRAHGFGKMVVKDIIGKYGGNVRYKEYDKCFLTEIIL